MLSPDQLVLIPLWYAMFLLSITCHEAAHAFAAYRGGDSTAYVGGQVTLNPVPHVRREPFGTVAVPLLSFLLMGWMMGWASAPYDPAWEERNPHRAATMAAAGPLANLVLAALGFAVLKAGLSAGWWVPHLAEFYELDRLVVPLSEQAMAIDALGRLCSIMLSLNLLLFVFNLIPLPPLDGAAVLAGTFEPARRFRDSLRRSSTGGLIGLLVAWYAIGYVYGPVYRLVMGWLFGAGNVSHVGHLGGVLVGWLLLRRMGTTGGITFKSLQYRWRRYRMRRNLRAVRMDELRSRRRRNDDDHRTFH